MTVDENNYLEDTSTQELTTRVRSKSTNPDCVAALKLPEDQDLANRSVLRTLLREKRFD
jgi:hypothetical protein